jgi:hypothetical protein
VSSVLLFGDGWAKGGGGYWRGSLRGRILSQYSGDGLRSADCWFAQDCARANFSERPKFSERASY